MTGYHTYSAVSPVCRGDDDPTITNIVTSMTERPDAARDRTRECLAVLRVAKHNSGDNPVLDGGGQLSSSKVRHLCALTEREAG